ncbi:SoxR reducing system RseC family protein [Oceanimonas sp. NS1]|nr:SoxR reducing system RseC family protein [Oceanimonas sp. NS1]
MIEEIATVTAVHAGRVEVSCFSKSACGQCRQSSSCGTGLVSKALPARSHDFAIATELALRPGQQVRIGIPEHSLIGGALLVYLLPLLCLLAGARWRPGPACRKSAAFWGHWPVAAWALVWPPGGPGGVAGSISR